MFKQTKLNLKKEAEIMRRLSHFLSAGQGIIESLSILSYSYPAIKEVEASVRKGKQLSKAFKDTKAFRPLSLKMIEVGEMTGTLPDSLSRLSSHFRRTHELRSKMINSSMYPLIVSLISVLMIFFLLFYIVPQILPVFENLKMSLPVTTKFLIKINKTLSDHFFLVGMIVCMLVLLGFCCAFVKFFRRQIFKISSRMYIIRSFTQNIFLISFCRTMGIMLQASIGVLQSLEIIKESERNPAHQKALENFETHIKQGRSFYSYLYQNPGIFGTVIPHFIEVGEKTGNLSNSFMHFADYVEYDLITNIDRLIHLLEPALIIILGLFVGFIALSLISPLYELSRLSNV
jgi:type IV pilus assembly protein PilC